jgi:hypothetical protein
LALLPPVQQLLLLLPLLQLLNLLCSCFLHLSPLCSRQACCLAGSGLVLWLLLTRRLRTDRLPLLLLLLVLL